MTVDEQIALANSLLSLLERVDNIAGRGLITLGMADDARRVILAQLVLIFPPLPPA